MKECVGAHSLFWLKIDIVSTAYLSYQAPLVKEQQLSVSIAQSCHNFIQYAVSSLNCFLWNWFSQFCSGTCTCMGSSILFMRSSSSVTPERKEGSSSSGVCARTTSPFVPSFPKQYTSYCKVFVSSQLSSSVVHAVHCVSSCYYAVIIQTGRR